MDRHEFEVIARDAIDHLPDRIREEIKDVIIVIEDHPSAAQKPKKGLLLGLYEGVPLTAWGRRFSGKTPDKITIFMQPILMVAKGPEDVPRVIRHTIWHEIGHYFGLDHDHIGRMEKRWNEQNR